MDDKTAGVRRRAWHAPREFVGVARGLLASVVLWLVLVAIWWVIGRGGP
jgi:hypothetical protein